MNELKGEKSPVGMKRGENEDRRSGDSWGEKQGEKGEAGSIVCNQYLFAHPRAGHPFSLVLKQKEGAISSAFWPISSTPIPSLCTLLPSPPCPPATNCHPHRA